MSLFGMQEIRKRHFVKVALNLFLVLGKRTMVVVWPQAEYRPCYSDEW